MTETCPDCGENYDPKKTGTDKCADCRDNDAEAAWDRYCENYYGGSSPVTIQEQCEAARKVGR